MRSLILPYTDAHAWLIKLLHWILFQSLATLRVLVLLLGFKRLLSIESWTSIRVVNQLGRFFPTNIFLVHLKFWLLHPTLDIRYLLVQLSNFLLYRAIRVRWFTTIALKEDIRRVRNIVYCITIFLFRIRIYLNFNNFVPLLPTLLFKLTK